MAIRFHGAAQFDRILAGSRRSYLTIVPTVHNLVTAELPADAIAILGLGGGRIGAIARMATALTDAGVDVKGFDVLVFIIGGRNCDAGTNALTWDEKTIPTSLFNDSDTLSFMQHEIGHLLGLDHPFDTNLPMRALKYGEYGDSTCIMSAESWGGRSNAAFAVVPAEQNAAFPAGDVLWRRCGPGVSPATLWRFAPEFPSALPWMSILPADAPPTQVQLSRPGKEGTRLLARSGGGNTWFTAEYRPASIGTRGSAPSLKPAPRSRGSSSTRFATSARPRMESAGRSRCGSATWPRSRFPPPARSRSGSGRYGQRPGHRGSEPLSHRAAHPGPGGRERVRQAMADEIRTKEPPATDKEPDYLGLSLKGLVDVGQLILKVTALEAENPVVGARAVATTANALQLTPERLREMGAELALDLR